MSVEMNQVTTCPCDFCVRVYKTKVQKQEYKLVYVFNNAYVLPVLGPGVSYRARRFIFKKADNSEIVELTTNQIGQMFVISKKRRKDIQTLFDTKNTKFFRKYNRLEKPLITPQAVIKRVQRKSLSLKEAEAYFMVFTHNRSLKDLSEKLFKSMIPYALLSTENANAMEVDQTDSTENECVEMDVDDNTSVNDMQIESVHPEPLTIYPIEEMERYYREEIEKHCNYQGNISL